MSFSSPQFPDVDETPCRAHEVFVSPFSDRRDLPLWGTPLSVGNLTRAVFFDLTRTFRPFLPIASGTLDCSLTPGGAA